MARNAFLSKLAGKKHLWITITFGLALLLGLFLRFYDLSAQPYWMDEGYTVNATMAVLENGASWTGISTLDSGRPYFCPLYCYPSAALVAWLGDSPAVFRFLAAIFGMLFVLVAYLIAKQAFASRAVAALTAALVALSYWQIAWSREARWYTMVAVFFWLALWFFQRFLVAQTKKAIDLIVAVCLTVLAITAHRLAYLLPLIMLAWYLLSLKKRESIVRIILIALGATGLVALVDLTVGHHFILVLARRVSFHYELPYYLSFLLREYWPLIALTIFGWFNAPPDAKRGMAKLLIPFLAYLAALSFLTDLVQYRYLFPVTLPLYAISAWTIVSVIPAPHPVIPAKAGIQSLWPVAVAATLLLSGTVIIAPHSFYWLEADDPDKLGPRPHYAYTPQPDWRDAYAFIKANRQPGDIIISSNPVFTKLYLGEPGYWQKYSYTGLIEEGNLINWDREYYVNATVVADLAALKQLTTTAHGFFVLDYMAADGKLPAEVLAHAADNFQLAYHRRLNSYSQIWIYRF